MVAFGYIPLKISILMATPLYRKNTPIIALFWIISIPNMHQCFRGVRHYVKLANIPCSQSVFHLFIYSFVRIISSSLITYLAHCNKRWHNISACTLQWGPHTFREWKYLFTFEADAKTPQTFSSKMWAISMPFACGKCILHDFWILAGSSEKISRLYGWILHVEYSIIKNMQNSKINGFQHSTHPYIHIYGIQLLILFTSITQKPNVNIECASFWNMEILIIIMHTLCSILQNFNRHKKRWWKRKWKKYYICISILQPKHNCSHSNKYTPKWVEKTENRRTKMPKKTYANVPRTMITMWLPCTSTSIAFMHSK